MTNSKPSNITIRHHGSRAGWLAGLVFLVTVSADGYSDKPSPVLHQLLYLPLTVLLVVVLTVLLRRRGADKSAPGMGWGLVLFEALGVAALEYETRHFAEYGYRQGGAGWVVLLAAAAMITATAYWTRRWSLGGWTLWAVGMFVAGWLFSISKFPLNYLRSDMLPVIVWADTNLLHHISPYATMHVVGRVYDFPYLPGMLLAYLPAIALGIDPRWMSLVYLLGLAAAFLWSALPEDRASVGVIVGLFLLCPFLQYRHELYLAPHWVAMVASFALMARGRRAWGAFVFGLSMGTYQFSWIVFPFLVLWMWRRSDWAKALQFAGAGLAGMLVVMGPFLHRSSQPIASNTVGQWGQMGHALAEPMNLSYWLTFVVAPAHLLRLQAVLMVALFGLAVFRGGCRTLASALRWSIAALTIFILTNSIVDGYCSLMLLVPVLFYTCLANGWLVDDERAATLRL